MSVSTKFRRMLQSRTRPLPPPPPPRLCRNSATLHHTDHALPPPPPSPRLAALKAAKPFSAFLTDRFHRHHNYLRISITERCNLRCLYCMPAEGIQLSPAPHLLSTPEILELASAFVAEGVTKIRLTGGEPTVRRDVVGLVESLGRLRSLGLKEIAMTSNGIALSPRKLDRMVAAGLTGLNLSLDTLVPAKFEFMTRRKGLERVLSVIERTTQELGFGVVGGEGRRTLKINVVVMRGVNEDEICDFVNMTRDTEVEVRFIEYMPFDGNKWATKKMFPFADMLATIHARYPTFAVLPTQRPNDTAKTYHVPGFAGKVGFITSMTENFCGSCNRLRITCDGNIKACLFGAEEVSLRDILRQYRSAEEPVGAGRGREEMRTRLIEAIGGAVGRKEEGHKPAQELADGRNRPMILIERAIYRNVGVVGVPLHLLTSFSLPRSAGVRHYSSSFSSSSASSKLPHLTPAGAAHMVSIHAKAVTTRTAVAVGHVRFSNPTPLQQIISNSNKKGDVLALARISGIMAAKKCPDLVVLCHPVALSSVEIDVVPEEEDGRGKGDGGQGGGGVNITARVTCEGKTGVEMEALTAVMGAALAVVDMCKAVDKRIVVKDVRVIEKRGGRSGDFFVD